MKSTQIYLHMLMTLHLVGDEKYKLYIIHCIILLANRLLYVFKHKKKYNFELPNQGINNSQSYTRIIIIVVDLCEQ